MGKRSTHRHSEPEDRQSLLPAAVLLLVSVIVIAVATLRPRDDARQVAAIFSPLLSAQDVARAVAQAGGRFVRPGAAEIIMVVELDDGTTPAALYRAGAWLVVDAIAAGGCLAPALSTTATNSTGRSSI